MDCLQYNFDNGSKRLPWSIRELFGKPKGFPDERWIFWKDGFDLVGGQDDVRGQTRSYAERIWLEMAVIEVLDRVAPRDSTTTSCQRRPGMLGDFKEQKLSEE
jgi:hypothetical protein